MRASDFSELAAFEAVARLRSFRRAADERKITASAISHAVTSLEQRVRLRLLNRTTRSVSLTDAGNMLLMRLGPAFGDIGGALDALNKYRDTPFGKVRLNVPNSIASFVVGPVLGHLVAKDPNLTIEVIATDRLVDIVEEGFDAGIRLGESLREGMIAVRIKPRLRLVVVGSPAYFKTHGIPKAPRELTSHICIQNLYPNGNRYPWEFQRGKQTASFRPNGPISLDDHALMVQVALSGVALAYVWEDVAARDIAEKRLVRCLDDWCQLEDWLYLYYPSRRNMSAGLRAVVDAMKV